MHREVVETRRKVYPAREDVNLVMKREKGKRRWVGDPGGVGREIVREVALCPRCRQ